jgi:hypothetical protein
VNPVVIPVIFGPSVVVPSAVLRTQAIVPPRWDLQGRDCGEGNERFQANRRQRGEASIWLPSSVRHQEKDVAKSLSFIPDGTFGALHRVSMTSTAEEIGIPRLSPWLED